MPKTEEELINDVVGDIFKAYPEMDDEVAYNNAMKPRRGLGGIDPYKVWNYIKTARTDPNDRARGSWYNEWKEKIDKRQGDYNKRDIDIAVRMQGRKKELEEEIDKGSDVNVKRELQKELDSINDNLRQDWAKAALAARQAAKASAVGGGRTRKSKRKSKSKSKRKSKRVRGRRRTIGRKKKRRSRKRH